MIPAALAAIFIPLAVAVVFASLFNYLTAQEGTKKAKAELTAGPAYRDLAEEYRRLSDMAVTATEHVDLRMTDLSVRVDELRDQLDQMQRILKDVE